MIEVKEVKTRREQREFMRFPIDLYKGHPSFIPPLYMDERKIFSPGYAYYDTCEAVYYLAYKDGKVAGRISGILQKVSNAKHNEKRIRFTRFDAIEDFEVAKALFDKVEQWGRDKGMDTICGPLGFSDLEREGLLIEGFDEPSTYEEQYNYAYYPEFIERLGYAKETDWTESQLSLKKDEDSTLGATCDYIMDKYHLKFGKARNINDFLRRYQDEIFDVLDISYSPLYGTVPFDDKTKKLIIDNFKLIMDIRHIACILDENDHVICFGFCIPSIADAVRKSGGRLTPKFIYNFLKAKAHPEVIDLCLIGVIPEWMNRGISVVLANEFIKMVKRTGVRYAETNLNLEDNYAINNLWKRFERRIHKKRRSYVKSL